MKLSKELEAKPIISIAEGEEIGEFRGFVVDPVAKSIVAILVEDDERPDEGKKVISFSLIHSIGQAAITTENASSVVGISSMPELVELVKRKIKIINSKVITRAGRFIGYVKEYSIDDRTGEIIGLELKSDANIPSPDNNVIPSENIVTIGKDIIIVDDDVENVLRGDHSLAGVGVVRPAAPKPAPKPAYTPPPAPAPQPVVQEAPEPAPAPIVEEKSGIDAESDVDIEELLDLDAAAESAGKVEEPAGISDIDRGMEAEEGKESLSEIFERRQIKYMLGKRVSKDVYSEDGRLVISQGDTITDDVIKAAKASGKFLELSMNIEIEE